MHDPGRNLLDLVRAAVQDFDRVSACEQAVDDVVSGGAGASDDECLHAGESFVMLQCDALDYKRGCVACAEDCD
jgi:hypothetical protein